MAVVCALPSELAAVQVVLDEVHPARPLDEGDANQYTFGRIGEHNVVVSCLPSGNYGQATAAVVVESLHRSYPHIRNVALVGIAGACPDPSDAKTDLRLGDVVVSQGAGVVHIDLLALAQSKDVKQLSHLPPPGQWWLGGVSNVQSRALKDVSAPQLDQRFADLDPFARPDQMDVLKVLEQ